MMSPVLAAWPLGLGLHLGRRIISIPPSERRRTHSSSHLENKAATALGYAADGEQASEAARRSREKRSFIFSDHPDNSPSPLHPNLRRHRQRPPSRCLGSVSSPSRSSRRQSVRQLTRRDSGAAVG
ncbi:hypothetical protein BT67DRAFT_54054 [Trichocladium antarcticum]|uniref:Uncharacterized protein n=1 Tax=Trichocladium antarcticum TaxID=1450529 RepID=A0AAN6UJ40_9PEZI|nr:hypothetical protein BT67DRAFT_54054 [Trichocladium antarcticum]